MKQTEEVLVMPGAQRVLFFQLMKEFNSKALTNRQANLTPSQKKHFDDGIYGIVDERDEGLVTHYQICLPPRHAEFIRWMLDHKA